MASTYTKPGPVPTTNGERIARYRRRQREERGLVEFRAWIPAGLADLIDCSRRPGEGRGATLARLLRERGR